MGAKRPAAAAAQSLVYPVADYDEHAKLRQFATGYGILTREAMVWFQKHYLRSPRMPRIGGPRRSRRQPGGARAAIVVTAECDVLHDDGERYAAGCAGRRAGRVPRYPGMIHAFSGMVPAVTTR
jgi:acetyl esterase